jgi:ABC-2 type transport system ATP-binding protein
MTVLLRDVTIRYGQTLAVDRATFELPRGAVGLLGRNGAGKSSILKALLGLVRPSSGEIRILDLPAAATPTEVRRHVGYMPERDGYVQGLSGYETVLLCARLSGLPERDAARRAHEVLYLVGLEEQRYRPTSGYSAGMRQKVKLAAALVHDPALLFLDEPTNGLDPKGRVEMLKLVGLLAGKLEKSVVLSSHILQDVEEVCSHVVLLEKGRVLASGTVAELTKSSSRSFELECTLALEEARASVLRDGALEAAPFGERGLEVVVPADWHPSRLFGAVGRAGGAVLRLVERRRTLEQVFLGAVLESGAKS